MNKLVLCILFTIISLICPTNIGLIGFNHSYGEVIPYRLGGFLYNAYHYPISLDEVQGKEIADIVIEDNGYTEPSYFIPFLISKKGELFDVYNLDRDIAVLNYLTACEMIRPEVITNGTTVTLYYYIQESSHQGILSLGLSGTAIGGKIESKNYNHTGSKYSIGTMSDYNGNSGLTSTFTFITPDTYRTDILYGATNTDKTYGIGIKDNYNSIYMLHTQSDEDMSYDDRIILGRTWYGGANKVVLTEDVGINDNRTRIRYEFEPTYLIPFWKNTIDIKTSSIDNIYLDNRGYIPNVPGYNSIKVIEEVYVPLNPNKVVSIGGFTEYTRQNNQGYLSAGLGIKFNIYTLNKCLNISFVFPLTEDNDMIPGIALSGTMEELF